MKHSTGQQALLPDFMKKLHAAGFEITVIDSEIPLWLVALTTPEEDERDEGGTCFNGIPIWSGDRWNICIQTTTPAVHSSEWYRHFHAELAQAVWDEDADGRKVTPKNLGDDK